MTRWIDALKRWNTEKGGPWCVPRKGSPEYDIVKGYMGPSKKAQKAVPKKATFTPALATQLQRGFRRRKEEKAAETERVARNAERQAKTLEQLRGIEAETKARNVARKASLKTIDAFVLADTEANKKYFEAITFIYEKLFKEFNPYVKDYFKLSDTDRADRPVINTIRLNYDLLNTLRNSENFKELLQSTDGIMTQENRLGILVPNGMTEFTFKTFMGKFLFIAYIKNQYFQIRNSKIIKPIIKPFLDGIYDFYEVMKPIKYEKALEVFNAVLDCTSIYYNLSETNNLTVQNHDYLFHIKLLIRGVGIHTIRDILNLTYNKKIIFKEGTSEYNQYLVKVFIYLRDKYYLFRELIKFYSFNPDITSGNLVLEFNGINKVANILLFFGYLHYTEQPIMPFPSSKQIKMINNTYSSKKYASEMSDDLLLEVLANLGYTEPIREVEKERRNKEEKLERERLQKLIAERQAEAQLRREQEAAEERKRKVEERKRQQEAEIERVKKLQEAKSKADALPKALEEYKAAQPYDITGALSDVYTSDIGPMLGNDIAKANSITELLVQIGKANATPLLTAARIQTIIYLFYIMSLPDTYEDGNRVIERKFEETGDIHKIGATGRLAPFVYESFNITILPSQFEDNLNEILQTKLGFPIKVETSRGGGGMHKRRIDIRIRMDVGLPARMSVGAKAQLKTRYDKLNEYTNEVFDRLTEKWKEGGVWSLLLKRTAEKENVKRRKEAAELEARREAQKALRASRAEEISRVVFAKSEGAARFVSLTAQAIRPYFVAFYSGKSDDFINERIQAVISDGQSRGAMSVKFWIPRGKNMYRSYI